MALLLQQYHNSVKGSYLEAAGIKGLLLHTATDLGQPGPDYKFGWGLANGEKAAQTIAASNDNLTTNNSTVKIAKITTNPALGANVTYTLKAKGAGTPLSASICWTDDEGAEQVESDGIDPTTGRLVYNFDIKLVDQVTNQEYFPWKGPGMANRTQNATRTSANDVDNFKRVDIDAPVAGRNYQLVITKRNTSPSAARQFTIIWTGLESATVPVELLSFTGKHTEGGNLLTWQTANEVNNKGFEVEKLRATGDSWVTIGFKTANNKAATYNFTDNAPLSAGSSLNSTSYYRLRQIDNDGKETLSKVVSVSRNSSTKLKVYPNPVSNVLTVENTDPKDSFGKGGDFQILNLLGQHVLNGKAAQHIDVSALPQGAYFLKVGTEQVKFIKQ